MQFLQSTNQRFPFTEEAGLIDSLIQNVTNLDTTTFNMNRFKWTVHKVQKKSRARIGTISTPHGNIETPAFIFCATKAAIKSLSTQQVLDSKTQIILSTYK